MLVRAAKAFHRVLRVPARSFYFEGRPFAATTKGRDIYLMPKSGNHKYSLIWMHGLGTHRLLTFPPIGDSAMGFLDFFNTPNSPVPVDKTRVVLLTAPEMSVTINSGMLMNAWFDHYIGKDGKYAFKQEEVMKSYGIVEQHIREEADLLGKDYGKVLLGGFSQGCALALTTGFTFEENLGGICGLSGFLFDFLKVDVEKRKKMPILLYHGKDDDVLPCEDSLKSYQRLMDKNMNVEIKTEEGLGHFVTPQEIKEVTKFFSKIIV